MQQLVSAVRQWSQVPFPEATDESPSYRQGSEIGSREDTH